MKSQYKTCVGVAIYNEEKYIAQTINSLKNQNADSVRFFISDNASTDKTMEIVLDLVAGDERFYVKRQERNIGSLKNHEYILKNNDSDYFMWLGGHDFISDDYLSFAIREMDADPDISMVMGLPFWVSEAGDEPELMSDAIYDFNESDPMRRYFLSMAKLSNCTIFQSMFRRKCMYEFEFVQVMAADFVSINRLLWHGKLKYISGEKYFRRRFDVREESYEERTSGAQNVQYSFMDFFEFYKSDFEKLAVNRISSVELLNRKRLLGMGLSGKFKNVLSDYFRDPHGKKYPSGHIKEKFGFDVEPHAAAGYVSENGINLTSGNIRMALESIIPRSGGVSLIRVGGKNHGGYLIPDDLLGVEACFSLGTSGYKDFEDRLARDFGIQSHISWFPFDPALFKTPLIAGMQFFQQKMMDGFETEISHGLGSWVDENASFGTDLILRLNAYGAEYKSILSAPDEILSRFRIVVLTVYCLGLLSNQEFLFEIFDPAMKKMARHFSCVHAHPINSHGDVQFDDDVVVPRALELTFLRKDRLRHAESPVVLPHPLDAVSVKERPAVNLTGIFLKYAD